MKVALISACLGIENVPRRYEDQVMPPGYSLDVFRITDIDMPPRASMSPRLLAKIPKILGIEVVPHYDIYIWVDASFEIPRTDSIAWLLKNLDDNDMVFFKHPQRSTVGEEISYLTEEINKKNPYICLRYKGEDFNPKWQIDGKLLACGVFAYRISHRVKSLMEEWFYQVCRWSVDDQLSLPYVLNKYQWEEDLYLSVICDENILHNNYFKHCRHK